MSLLDITAMLGNVGEFLGSLLVLGTLIYLAFQVQQAKQLLQTSITLNRGAANREITAMRMNNPRLVELEAMVWELDRKKSPGQQVDPAETYQLFMDELGCSLEDAILLANWRYVSFRAIEMAFLTEGDAERSRVSIGIVLRTELDRKWWQGSRSMFTTPFAEYVDNWLAAQTV